MSVPALFVVWFLISFSLSAMEATKPEPRASPRFASSQRKTPQFGCVDANTPATRPTATARTSRTSLYLLRYTNQQSPECGGVCVSCQWFDIHDKDTVAVTLGWLYGTTTESSLYSGYWAYSIKIEGQMLRFRRQTTRQALHEEVGMQCYAGLDFEAQVLYPWDEIRVGGRLWQSLAHTAHSTETSHSLLSTELLNGVCM